MMSDGEFILEAYLCLKNRIIIANLSQEEKDRLINNLYEIVITIAKKGVKIHD